MLPCAEMDGRAFCDPMAAPPAISLIPYPMCLYPMPLWPPVRLLKIGAAGGGGGGGGERKKQKRMKKKQKKKKKQGEKELEEEESAWRIVSLRRQESRS